MINVLLTGIGGQGTVLAAKVLAQAAMNKGWEVRTAETIGMAQRGGSVVSHVRMGDIGEPVYEPLVPLASADLIIAFEPSEAVRVLPYLKNGGVLVTAISGVQPVTATLSEAGYRPEDMLTYLESAVPRLVTVEDKELCDKVGSRKVLNTALLAQALQATDIGISIGELQEAVRASVKARFVELNLRAIDVVTKDEELTDEHDR